MVRWHERLTGKASMERDGSRTGSDREDGGMRGYRSELKRVGMSDEVMLSPCFAELAVACYPGTLEGEGSHQAIRPREIEALARTAMIMAHIDRCHLGRSVPEAFADGRDRPAVSEARVAALLRTQDAEDAARQIRVMVPMITGGIDPVRLHEALGDWEQHRKAWAITYYTARQRAKRSDGKAA